MFSRVPDAIFEHPRLVAIYDALDPDRSDLDVYVAIAEELAAGQVLDIGCGTGTFALLLAGRGLEVLAVDPAAGSLGVARAKPGAERVHWIHGDATALPPMQMDLATMTANVAQAIVDPLDWQGTLRGAYDALRPGGHLVFETRDPAYRAWREWNRTASYSVAEIDGVGAVESWVDVTDVSGPLVTFRSTVVFGSDGQVLTSNSTLRFRERAEVEATLVGQGYSVDEVRSAPIAREESSCSLRGVRSERATGGSHENAYRASEEGRHRQVVLIGRGDLELVPRCVPAERRVEDDQVEPAVDTAEHIAATEPNPIGDAVDLGVVQGRFDSSRVDVHRHDQSPYQICEPLIGAAVGLSFAGIVFDFDGLLMDTVHLDRAIRIVLDIGLVQITRWADAGSHLHLYVYARLGGLLQMRGTFLALWDDLLPAVPV